MVCHSGFGLVDIVVHVPSPVIVPSAGFFQGLCEICGVKQTYIHGTTDFSCVLNGCTRKWVDVLFVHIFFTFDAYAFPSHVLVKEFYVFLSRVTQTCWENPEKKRQGMAMDLHVWKQLDVSCITKPSHSGVKCCNLSTEQIAFVNL